MNISLNVFTWKENYDWLICSAVHCTHESWVFSAYFFDTKVDDIICIFSFSIYEFINQYMLLNVLVIGREDYSFKRLFALYHHTNLNLWALLFFSFPTDDWSISYTVVFVITKIKTHNRKIIAISHVRILYPTFLSFWQSL